RSASCCGPAFDSTAASPAAFLAPSTGITDMPAHQSRPSVRSTKGMVVAAHPLAAAAGAAMLDTGGNAFDAVVAAAAALNVAEPYMSGLLGLGMATCWVAKEKRMRTLDFQTPVPRRFPTASIAKNATVNGPLA